MGGASSFITMLAISGFLLCLWLAARVSRIIGISSIVTEVAVGMVLGPQVGNLIPSGLGVCFEDQMVDCNTRAGRLSIAQKGTEFCDLDAYVAKDIYTPLGVDWKSGFFGASSKVTLDGVSYCVDPDKNKCTRRLDDSVVVFDGKPFDVAPAPRRLGKDQKGKTKYDTYEECLMKSCKLDVALECANVPDVFTLIGHTGVALMIFESGMHFDFEQAKTVGPWACAVAVLGTFLPLLSGTALSMAYGFPLMDSLAAGTALAPTSVGIALKLLHEAKALQLYFGQAVMTAAFVDDVLSLILFSVLFNLGDDVKFMDFFPLIMGCVFMVVAIIAAVTVWPKIIKFIFEKIPEKYPHARLTFHDELMWLLMFATLIAYATITHYCGTHLWGCFIAGMSFATQHHAHHVWVRQVKRTTCWWMRIFFGCTLAWSIPVGELFSLDAFWKGTIMGIGPCIAAKVLSGPFMGEARWVIGWAMVGRAEFAYFIAILAKSLTLMDEKLFAILVWALIYATIFAPFIFRSVLVRYMKKAYPEVDIESGPQLGHRNSEHLPDYEAEEEEQRHAEMEEKLEKLEKELAQANEQIKKIMDSTEKTTDADMPVYVSETETEITGI